jgi:ABC-type dipeptide/oligopeptide/nickel transport system permease subunit
MATIAEQAVTAAQPDLGWELRPAPGFLRRWGKHAVQNPAGALGFIIVVAFVVVGAIGPYITPYDPKLAIDVTARFEGPSSDHWLGTNNLGLDLFSRILKGARISLLFGLIVVFLGFLPGSFLGILSGYAGRWVDYVIQRSGEAWTAFPQLPLFLAFITAFGRGLDTIAIVVAIGAVFGGSRLLRAVVMVEKHQEYVTAARALGARESRILLRHILPNIMPYIIVGLSSVFAIAILAEAALSFLGLGLETGEPGWGNDLAAAREFGSQHPHMVIFPGLAISIVVFGFNMLGDALRDVLDPRLRGSR